LILEFWEFAAFIANSLVFLLIGLTLAKVPFSSLGLAPLAIAIALVLLGRAITVYPLSAAFGRSRWSIDMGQQHVLWWGGLRGALALALALSLSLPDDIPLRNDIVIATFAVVGFSVVVQGLTMPALLRLLKLLPTTR
jgi:CPA1 family monovalent cation:H+ antiporter